MNQAVKEKWLAALESGEYTHGKGQLVIPNYDDEGYSTGNLDHCCLGVLCELAIQEGIIDRIPETTESDFRAGLYLPEAVEDWAELPYITQDLLAQKNDLPATDSYAPVIDFIRGI